MASNITKNKEKFIPALMIVISYFIFPYLVAFMTNSKSYSILIYLAYGIILMSIYRKSIKLDLINIKKQWKKYIKTIIIGVFLIFLTMIGINLILGIVLNIKETSENDFSLLSSFKENPLIVILLTCIYYPIVEGIVFRKAIRDIIDSRWFFILFSAMFYFFFNIVYTSMSFSNIMSSLCYFTTMIIVSNIYYKTNNFVISVIIMSLFNLIVSVLSFI